MQLIEHIIEVTGGSSSDLESASSIAEVMVKSLGMSDKIGLRVYQVPIPTNTATTSGNRSFFVCGNLARKGFRALIF